MKFEIGDLVMIKPYSIIKKYLDIYGRDKKDKLFFAEDYMKKYCGKVYRVIEYRIGYNESVRYALENVYDEGAYWLWTERWLEPFSKRPKRKHNA